VAAVITVNTSQNTKGVKSFRFVNPELVLEQLNLILEEMEIKGVKVGIPHENRQVNERISAVLSDLSVPVVFDPVISPTFGPAFFTDFSAFQPILEVSTVVTPNFAEFNRLKEFLKGRTVIVKGVPSGRLVCDVLLSNGEEVLKLCHERDNRTVRGTGCAFSSALTSFLAEGRALKEAFKKSVSFIEEYRERAVLLKGAAQLYPRF